MEDWIIVDTCIWISYFAHSNSPDKALVEELISSDRIAIVGPILAEVLQGIKNQKQADWIASRLRLAHYLEASWEDWRTAANIGKTLRSSGHKLPLTDLVISALARRLDISVYSSDPHFDLIEDLKRFPKN